MKYFQINRNPMKIWKLLHIKEQILASYMWYHNKTNKQSGEGMKTKHGTSLKYMIR